MEIGANFTHVDLYNNGSPDNRLALIIDKATGQKRVAWLNPREAQQISRHQGYRALFNIYEIARSLPELYADRQQMGDKQRFIKNCLWVWEKIDRHNLKLHQGPKQYLSLCMHIFGISRGYDYSQLGAFSQLISETHRECERARLKPSVDPTPSTAPTRKKRGRRPLPKAPPAGVKNPKAALSEEEWPLFARQLAQGDRAAFHLLETDPAFRRMVQKKLEEAPLSEELRHLPSALRQLSAYPESIQSQSGLLRTLFYLQKTLHDGAPIPLTPSTHHAHGAEMKIRKTASGLPFSIALKKNDQGEWQVAFLQTPLGQGSYKNVKLMLDPENKQSLVPSKQTKNLAQARREIELTHQCRGLPNVIQLISTSTYINKKQQEVQVTTTPFFNAGTLEQWIKTGRAATPLSEAERWRRLGIAHEIATGITQIHRKNITHRDLKLDNILLEEKTDPDGAKSLHLVVSDLGEACEMTPAEAQEVFGWGGTDGYMPPEIVCADPVPTHPTLAEIQAFGQKRDAWAFGIMLSRLFQDRLPFGMKWSELLKTDSLARCARLQKAFSDYRQNPPPAPPDRDSIDYVIWKLTQPYQAERCTVEQALQMIQALLNQPPKSI